MLLTTEYITDTLNKGMLYLSNIVTNKFYRNRYSLTGPSTHEDDKLLMLMYAVNLWSSIPGAVNPYKECQLVKLLQNILKAGKDNMSCYTCKTKVEEQKQQQQEEINPPPPPVETVTIRWDYFDSDPGDPVTATLGRSITITKGADFTIPTKQISYPAWLIFSEPASEPAKHSWKNTTFNYGSIANEGTNGTAVWLAPVTSGDRRYYKTRDLTAFDSTANTRFSKT